MTSQPSTHTRVSQDPRLSNYAFAPLYVWKAHFQFYWARPSEHLCIFAKQGEDYFMPILPMPCDPENRSYRNVIRTAYQFMLASNRNPHIARIENVPQEMIALPLKRMGFVLP